MVTETTQTVKDTVIDHVVRKFLEAFDPIIDPIVEGIKKAFTWIRNKLSRRGYPRPTILTVEEYDAEEDIEPILIVP